MGGVTSLDVYPNPSSDIFNISFVSDSPMDIQIRLVNLVGEEIMIDDIQKFVGEYVKSVNINKKSRGVYLLEIIIDHGFINKKLILQ